MEHETFKSLICDLAHWEFELFLIFVFDVVVGAVVWPQIKKRLKRRDLHHEVDDQQIADLQQRIMLLEQKLGISAQPPARLVPPPCDDHCGHDEAQSDGNEGSNGAMAPRTGTNDMTLVNRR